MTTDGQLAHRLISPRWKAEKTYEAHCEGRLTQRDAEAFAAGLVLSDFTAKPAKLEIVEARITYQVPPDQAHVRRRRPPPHNSPARPHRLRDPGRDPRTGTMPHADAGGDRWFAETVRIIVKAFV